MSSASAIVRSKGEGPRRWFYGGGTHTWKVTAEESGGGFFVYEDEMTQGKATPLHAHPEVEETIFVLEGDILLNIDGTEHAVGSGGLSFVPRGVPHAFTVLSESARLLTMQSPGAAQPFYWNASEPAMSEEAGPTDFDRVRQAAQETGATRILGPPPFNTQ